MDRKEVPLAELQENDQKGMQSLDYWYRVALHYIPHFSLSLCTPPPKFFCFSEENSKV